MKKIFGILICVLFLGSVFLGLDVYANKQYQTLLNEQFDSNIYLETGLDYEDFFQTMAQYSETYQFDLQKVILNFGDEQTTADSFLLIRNQSWFKEQFPINDNTNLSTLKADEYISSQNTGFLGQVGKLPLLYTDGVVNLRPFIALENRQIEGKYGIHLSEEFPDIAEIIAQINTEGKVLIHSNSDVGNVFPVYSQTINWIYQAAFLVILFGVILTLFIHLRNDGTKKMAIQRLWGYSSPRIMRPALGREILAPIGLGLMLTIVVFLGHGLIIGAFEDWAIMTSYLGILAGVLGLMVVLLGLGLSGIALIHLSWISHGKNSTLSSILKGARKSTLFFNKVIKVISAVGVTTAILFCIISFQLLWQDLQDLPYWESAKNYATVKLYSPEYMRNDQKLYGEMANQMPKVWGEIDARGGIMFAYTEGSPLNDDKEVVIDGTAKSIPFAYVNQNYLDLNPLVDAQGQPIGVIDQQDDHVVTILIPEKYKGEEAYLREKIHLKHIKDRFLAEDIYTEWITGEKSALMEENMNNPLIKENIIYIANDQRIFSYNPVFSFVDNPVLFCVNSSNMGGNVYLPSLFGGTNGLKIKCDDFDETSKEIDEIFVQAGCGVLAKQYIPLMDEVADDIYLFKSSFYASVILLIVSMIFLVFSVFFFIQSYLHANRAIIAVKHFLGFGLLKKHGKIYFSMIIETIFSGAAASLVYTFTVYKYTGPIYYIYIVLLCVLILFLDLFLTTMMLKKQEGHMIVNTLKGE